MSVTMVQPDVFVSRAPATRSATGALTDEEAPFADALRAAGPRGSDREREARQVAEQLVATTFIEPILSMLRDTNTAAGPFAPSSAERRFTPMLDQHLSERIVHGTRFPLIDRITEDLVRAGPARVDDWRETREKQHDDA